MIKRKSDVQEFLYSFCLHSKWDGKKFYFVINHPEGTITLMQYPDEHFTVHRMSDVFCDISETSIEGEELNQLIWRYRKFINRGIKVIMSKV
jgi:hypothetical protein